MNAKTYTDIGSLRNFLGEWKSPFSPRYGSDFDDYVRSKQYFGYKFATWTTSKGLKAVLIEDSAQHELAITLVDAKTEFPRDVEDSVRFACGLCGITF